MNEPNLAVLDAQISNVKETLNRIIKIQEDQIEVNQSLARTVALLQQSQQITQHQIDGNAAEIDSLKQTRSEQRGGYSAIMIIGGCLATILGFVGSWLQSLFHSSPKQ